MSRPVRIVHPGRAYVLGAVVLRVLARHYAKTGGVMSLPTRSVVKRVRNWSGLGSVNKRAVERSLSALLGYGLVARSTYSRLNYGWSLSEKAIAPDG